MSSHVPSLFTTLPPLRDLLNTDSSAAQDETVQACLPYLKNEDGYNGGLLNEYGLPPLDREAHAEFLHGSLGAFPAKFVGIDASRPWMVYWALCGLQLLGEDISVYRERVISTFKPMQNPSGGFGGGHGQTSHIAPTYAAVLSLAMVGGEEAYNIIDRRSMWRWLATLKQPDGGLAVSVGGEKDVRGAYCGMTVMALLSLPLELPPDAEARDYGFDKITDGLSTYLSRCQTYEGGIAADPGLEAHGAYTFCGLACLCILGEASKMIQKYLDMPSLLSWLSARQNAPEGGYSGRTNKLVDACYSHWVGGCWPLVQAALSGPRDDPKDQSKVVGSLYSREGLSRYILCCCQSEGGGLRDKPGKYPDSYHTCYTTVGLSSIQHYNYFESSTPAIGPFADGFAWKSLTINETTTHEPDQNVFDEGDRVKPVHPLFVISHESAASMRAWYEKATF